MSHEVNLMKDELLPMDSETIRFTEDRVLWKTKNGVITESLTMRDHLEKLLSRSCRCSDLSGVHCFWCDSGSLYNEPLHSAGCPHVAAKAFLERGCVP